jgi:signal transduction histidine kinase
MAELVPFSVDVHLLTELGERLVGRPAIALGELVKNSYDADAAVTRVEFKPSEITVVDDGHGMTEDVLRSGFLRVGTPRKDVERFSPSGRRMTGSKGVGRLAVQMLGRKLTLETRPATAPDQLLRLRIDWDKKEDGKDIQTFMAEFDRPPEPSMLGDKPGTAIRIEELRTEWTTGEVETLARDVWMLRSPFPADDTDDQVFSIEFEAEEASLEQAFERVIRGWIDLYEAKLTGEFHSTRLASCRIGPESEAGPHVHLDLEFDDGARRRVTVPATSSSLGQARFEINIYMLQGRQPLGLSVRDVRKYLNKLGGVYLYDDGFRLPYYGPDTDWLGIEMDHAHRLAASKVLPKDLQTKGGLTFLPTTSRLFGAVHVSTSRERERVASGEVAETESLQIQISRDRLLDTAAFSTLRDAVRSGLDLYAHEKARIRLREAEEKLRKTELADQSQPSAVEVLEVVAGELSDDSYRLLQAAIIADTDVYTTQLEVQERRAAAMAALATAGMVSLVLEHEYARLLPRLTDFADRFEGSDDAEVRGIAFEIRGFADQLEALSPMLRSLMEPENRVAAKLSARKVVTRSLETIGLLLRGIEIENDVDGSVRLPEGSLAEWSALFENVLLNAANAVMGQDGPRIRIVARGAARSVQVLDNGYGIDPDRAEGFFEPFVRGEQQLPPERRVLGMGGTGLGLTIVRTIAEAHGATATFTSPPRGWATSFVLRW